MMRKKKQPQDYLKLNEELEAAGRSERWVEVDKDEWYLIDTRQLANPIPPLTVESALDDFILRYHEALKRLAKR